MAKKKTYSAQFRHKYIQPTNPIAVDDLLSPRFIPGIVHARFHEKKNAAKKSTKIAEGSAAAAKDRRRRPETTGDLSPFGTSQGWSERSAGAGAGAKRAGNASTGGTPFGSGSGARRRSGSSNSNSNGSPFDSSRAPGDDSISTPPSPGPPRPPTPPGSSPRTPSSASRTAGASNSTQPHKPSPGPPAAAAPAPTPPPSTAPVLAARPSYRDKRFDDVLGEDVVKLDELRKLSWNGVPQVHRAAVWQLLVGYMPANRARRGAALERKRREYREAVPQYFDVPDAARSHQEQNILRQILVDVPRTCPDVPFFHQDKVRAVPERPPRVLLCFCLVLKKSTSQKEYHMRRVSAGVS